MLLNSPALAAINRIWKDAPKPPNPGNLEAYHAWFLEVEKLFKEMIHDKDVTALLDSPIEKLDVIELDKVMKQICAHWPVAWSDHIRSFSDMDSADKELQWWVRAGLEKDFPSVQLFFPIPGDKDKSGVKGNGTPTMVDGELMVVTAEHVLELSGLKPDKDYWRASTEEDTTIFPAADYKRLTGYDLVLPPHIPPYKPSTPASLKGARIVVPGHDDNGVLFGKNRRNKKAYISSGLPATEAVELWRFAQSTFTAQQEFWSELVASMKAPKEKRDANMTKAAKIFRAHQDKEPDTRRGGVIIMLPPDELEVDINGAVVASGMSGSGARSSGALSGVFVSDMPIHVKSTLYACARIKTAGIDQAIEKYRASKRPKTAQAKG